MLPQYFRMSIRHFAQESYQVFVRLRDKTFCFSIICYVSHFSICNLFSFMELFAELINYQDGKFLPQLGASLFFKNAASSQNRQRFFAY